MLLNSRGFTLVEILAAVAILSILTVLAIAGYTRYIDYSKRESYETMAHSISVAAEEYVMDFPGEAVETKEVELEDNKVKYIIKEEHLEGISVQDLIEKGYLKSALDPDNKGEDCKGNVVIGLVKTEKQDNLDQYIYEVNLCCKNYQNNFLYTIEKTNNTTKSIIESNKDKAYCP